MIKIFNFQPVIKQSSSINIFNHLNIIIQRWHDDDIEFIDIDNTDNVDSSYRFSKSLNKLCIHNYNIWHAEDYCRSKIAENILKYKPIIDLNNQLRNDSIEELDVQFITDQLGSGKPNSETLGSIYDRIIITLLKYLHTNDLNINGKFDDRMGTLNAQLSYLLICADNLYDGMITGTSRIIPFRQLKMYNDAETNTKIPVDPHE